MAKFDRNGDIRLVIGIMMVVASFTPDDSWPCQVCTALAAVGSPLMVGGILASLRNEVRPATANDGSPSGTAHPQCKRERHHGGR